MTEKTKSPLNESLAAVGPAWNRFWFTPADALPLGMIRVLAGLLAIYLLTTYSWDLPRFFESDGLVSVSTTQQLRTEMATTGRPREQFAFSYLDWFNTAGGLYTAHVISLAVLAAFTLGIFTRATSIGALIVVLSYFHRGPLLTSQLEPMLCATLFYLCLAPAGATLSFDRWLANRRAQKAAEVAGAKSAPTPEPAEPTMAAGIVLRLIQVHLSLIFLMMAIGKLSGPLSVWWTGEAVWWLLARPETRPFDLTGMFAQNTFTEFLVDLWTHFIVWFELAFAVLIWNRWARPILLLGAFVLWGPLVAVSSGLFAFAGIMLTLVVAFVPPERLRLRLAPVLAQQPALA